MGVFDAYVLKLGRYVQDALDRNAQVREFQCPTTVDGLLGGLPVRVGPGANPGVVMRADTSLELGSPEAGSCAFPLWTDSPSLVKDGMITLIGPDIQESAGASLPFGQVLIAGGEGLGEGEHSALEQSQYVSDQVEGYMIKSTPGRMWSRVSKDAAAKGFSFESLGRALMAIYKSEVAKVQAMQVVFVTSSREDVQRLDDIAAQVQKISRDIVRQSWLARGYDILECTLGWDCGSCPDKPVCDDIREVISVRKRRDKGPNGVDR